MVVIICPRCKCKVLPYRSWLKHECSINGFFYFLTCINDVIAMREWYKEYDRKLMYGE